MSNHEVDRVADAIARKKGAGPLHLMPDDRAGQYRAMARAAMTASASVIAEQMEHFPQNGRHTRAGWAVLYLRMLAEESR